MPECRESDLKKQIEANTLTGLYVLYGDEKYMVAYWAKRLIKKAAGKTFLDFNLQCFSGDAAADALDDAVQALPFMASRKCVAVSDLSLDGRTPSENKKLLQLFADVPDTTVLVLSFAASDPPFQKDKKWKKLYTECSKSGTCVACRKHSRPELKKTLVAAANRRGCVLQRVDAGKMVRYVGDDLTALHGELEKVCAYTGSGPIAPKTIDLLVTRNLEARVYDLSRALLAGHSGQAYRILNQLLEQNEPPVRILAVLTGAYVDLYRVRTALQSGESAMEPAKYFPEYKNRQFRLTNAERDAHGLSTQRLRASLDILLAADLDLKGSHTAEQLILEKALARLLLAARGEKSA
ncbi:DNA polymerase III subunit delta [Caproicibacterium lactatifermentans]|uniref:DNA polymerase III subunit delta n=1 Tax=Caproicibacterium lactatifermentans TaxID=2666138 RepID=A0ABX6PWT7_9FIRM|nr:DNA polymerase III subunit delta [Caproicibacterium lactatifermentans]QKO30642.1 DNA polymerase III subunit delta [Caproicibacterium lactatifermentans]